MKCWYHEVNFYGNTPSGMRSIFNQWFIPEDSGGVSVVVLHGRLEVLAEVVERRGGRRDGPLGDCRCLERQSFVVVGG